MKDTRKPVFNTPRVPAEFARLGAPGYRNIWKIAEASPAVFPDPNHPNLWGTETLCGDWDGNVLVVLKDFASTGWLETRRDGRPYYSHGPDVRTNRNLVCFLRDSGVEIDEYELNNTTCGVLYVSANFLLLEGVGMSNGISREALEESWPVLDFTIKSMPNLTDIVLGGVEAFATFQRHGGLTVDRKSALAGEKPMTWRGRYRVHVTAHTADRGIHSRRDRQGRVGWAAVRADWKRIFRHVRGD